MMLTKPWAEMDQAELLAVEAQCGRRVQELNNLFAEFRAVSTTRQKARQLLVDRFGFDPRTGKRLRKGRALL